jgi:hypothetical protein
MQEIAYSWDPLSGKFVKPIFEVDSALFWNPALPNLSQTILEACQAAGETMDSIWDDASDFFSSLWHLIVHSPVDIEVIDPLGRTLTQSTSDIPYTFFITTEEKDGGFIEHFYIYQPMDGDYTIKVTPKGGVKPDETYSLILFVTPKGGVKPDETYSLILFVNGEIRILAEDVPVYDIPENGYVTPVPLWSSIKLLPATKENKAGRTIPIKFSIETYNSDNSEMTFVHDENLEIRVYDTLFSQIALQVFDYGEGSSDYRISDTDEKYIANFMTLKQPASYLVEIWRIGMNLMVGSFTFETY